MKRLVLIAFLMLFFACSDQAENSKSNQVSDVDRAMAILEKQGFNMAKVSYDGNGYFIIDDDAQIALETVLATKGRSKQWRTQYIMTQSNSANIKIRISSNVPSNWVSATRSAIANWNAVSGTKLKMTEVSSGENLVVNYSTFSPSGAIARATFPDASGNVGHTITINTNWGSLSSSKKIFTMTHEIGHCIGFRHTNWFDRNSDGNNSDSEPQLGAQHIAGTPSGLDPNSVMNAFVGNWSAFSQYDVIAVRNLYPGTTTPPPTGGIQGPSSVPAGTYATFTSPAGSSYQWWYNIGWGWTRWNGVTSRSVTFTYNGTVDLAVVVNGTTVYYKRNINFY